MAGRLCGGKVYRVISQQPAEYEPAVCPRTPVTSWLYVRNSVVSRTREVIGPPLLSTGLAVLKVLCSALGSSLQGGDEGAGMHPEKSSEAEKEMRKQR